MRGEHANQTRVTAASSRKLSASFARSRRAAGACALAAVLAGLYVTAAPLRSPDTTARAAATRLAAAGAPAVGIRVMRLVDPTRSLRLRGGRTIARTLTTYVRYPALGASGRTDVANAPLDTSAGALPLIVFVHGFAVTPSIYAALLQSWARAGFVVAAPVFPGRERRSARRPRRGRPRQRAA